MRNNSEAVIANAFINPDEFLNVTLLFDLDVASELEIENWIVKSIKYLLENVKENYSRYYIDHLNGSNVFIIRKTALGT